MNDNTTKANTHTDENLKDEEMLAEYDFSHARPGRHRKKLKTPLVRVLPDGTEQPIEPSQTPNSES